MSNFLRATAFALLTSPLAVPASGIPSVLGDWNGAVIYPAGNSANANGLSLDMIFQSQILSLDGSDALGGMWEVTCTSSTAPSDCVRGGYHSFSATSFDTGVVSFTLTNQDGILLSDSNQFAAGYDSFTANGNDASGTSISLEATRLQPVPIPAAAWLMLSGLGALGLLRRKPRAGSPALA